MKTLGKEEFTRQVEEEWERIRDGAMELDPAEIERVKSYFQPHEYDANRRRYEAPPVESQPRAFQRWLKYNTEAHRVSGYRIVHVSLKSKDLPPGDVTDAQMEGLADLADAYSFGEVRTTHRQNMVMADVGRARPRGRLEGPRCAEPRDAQHRHTEPTSSAAPGSTSAISPTPGSIAVSRNINHAFDELDTSTTSATSR